MEDTGNNYDLWNDRRTGLRFDHKDHANPHNISERRVTTTAVANERRKLIKRSIWRSGRLERISLMAGDFFAVSLSFIVASTFAAGIGNILEEPANLIVWWHTHGSERIHLFAALIILSVVIFWLQGQYTRKLTFWDELPQILKVILVIGCLDAALMFFGKLDFSRSWLLLTWTAALVLVPAIRLLIKTSLVNSGLWRKPTVIIGIGNNAKEAALAMQNEPLLGYNVKSFISPPTSWVKDKKECALSGNKLTVNRSQLPVFRSNDKTDDLGELLLKLGKPHVILALESGDHIWKATKNLNKFADSYSSINVVPSFRGLPLLGMEVVHFFRHEVLLLRVQNNLARKIPQRIKRLFDILVASALLILLTPVFLTISYLISQTGSKVFFKHKRVGQNGKSFKCCKFQSMCANSDEMLKDYLENNPLARKEWQETLKLKNDPRVTPIGAFLRKTSLDELPQLLNVLKGEMSLVGPRPIVKSELARYGEQVNFYLETKPGMTGVWQVSGRNNTSYQERVSYDVWYAKNWTLWYDIIILMKTFKEVTRRSGAY